MQGEVVEVLHGSAWKGRRTALTSALRVVEGVDGSVESGLQCSRRWEK